MPEYIQMKAKQRKIFFFSLSLYLKEKKGVKSSKVLEWRQREDHVILESLKE